MRALLLTVLMAAVVPVTTPKASPRMTCGSYRGDAARGTWCTLLQADTVMGRQFAAGTNLRYDPSGVLRYFVLKQPTVVDGWWLAGGSSGPHHEVYANGTPRMFWLARSQDIQGIPCRAMSFWTEIIRQSSAVLFYPNGHLQRCRTAREVTIQGQRFGPGALVRMSDAGVLLPAPARGGHQPPVT